MRLAPQTATASPASQPAATARQPSQHGAAARQTPQRGPTPRKPPQRHATSQKPPQQAATARKPPEQAASPDEYAIDMSELLADAVSCDNCGAKLPADAVVCVQCGYDSRQGEVMGRTSAAETKKKRRGKLRFPALSPVVLAIAGGAVVLIGVGVFFALRGGSWGAATGTAAATADPSNAPSGRAPRPEPSKDPNDWRTSFPAFAASLSASNVSTPSGWRWEVRGGPFNLAEDSGTITWEGVLMGRDRRSITSARPDGAKHAFGFRFPELASMPNSFAVLFAIDETLATQLLKLSYRRVRIEGKLEPQPRVVWLDKDGFIDSIADGPPLQAGEATLLDWPKEGEPIKPIYVVWFDITRFELVK